MKGQVAGSSSSRQFLAPSLSYCANCLRVWRGKLTVRTKDFCCLHKSQPRMHVYVWVRERERVPGIKNFGGKTVAAEQFQCADRMVGTTYFHGTTRCSFKLDVYTKVNPIEFNRAYFKMNCFEKSINLFWVHIKNLSRVLAKIFHICCRHLRTLWHLKTSILPVALRVGYWISDAKLSPS